MGFTSRSVPRRAVLRALPLTPLVLLSGPSPAGATEYGSAEEVLIAVDRLEAEVAARLRALEKAFAPARALAASLLADHERHRADRARLRRHLRLPKAAPASPAAAGDTDLTALREVQQALVHAHAEGLPAMGSPFAVDMLARHMVEVSRHLTVIDLWLEAEAQRG